ncbi:MAG TPA: hypothetical protein VF498_11305 [Anaerolineales bacterium]
MDELLQFLEKYEIWIYALAGVIGLFYFQRLAVAWREWRAAIFGLERENAQRRFSSAMTAMILIALFVMAEFILVSFVSPGMPQVASLSTPTLNPLATATTTLQPGDATGLPATPTIAVVALATPPSGQCQPGQIEWTDPTNGKEISGTVILMGTVNVTNFGFYKYEFSSPQDNNWETIAAGNKIVTNGELGRWNTVSVTPGDYLLRLVVIDNQQQAYPACVINVRITAPPSP